MVATVVNCQLPQIRTWLTEPPSTYQLTPATKPADGLEMLPGSSLVLIRPGVRRWSMINAE